MVGTAKARLPEEMIVNRMEKYSWLQGLGYLVLSAKDSWCCYGAVHRAILPVTPL